MATKSNKHGHVLYWYAIQSLQGAFIINILSFNVLAILRIGYFNPLFKISWDPERLSDLLRVTGCDSQRAIPRVPSLSREAAWDHGGVVLTGYRWLSAKERQHVLVSGWTHGGGTGRDTVCSWLELLIQKSILSGPDWVLVWWHLEITPLEG